MGWLSKILRKFQKKFNFSIDTIHNIIDIICIFKLSNNKFLGYYKDLTIFDYSLYILFFFGGRK